ncbi:MAG TPA: hypothetical protein VLE53_10815 [Gemmatimonadaceae bacterium]|nr:hypothetical protein [Gemmatimonadaceae bacterium]
MGNTNHEELFVGTAEIDGRSLAVTVAVTFDDVEHVGHLWFRDSEWDEDEGVRDHGALPGRSPHEILSLAQGLSLHDLALRYRRAQAERRRFHGLRRLTQDVLAQIRYLNRVATSMRAGLLDIDEAAAEIASTEQRLYDMVGQLRHYAGVPT